MKRYIGILVLLTVLPCACQPDGRSAVVGWEGQIDSLPGGAVSVHNTGHGLWPDSGEWRVVEDLRIGSVDAEGPENFGRIVSMTIDGRGRFWVLDGQASELRVFSAAGEYVRTVGRAGGGPGEFRQPVRVDEGPDGNMWVMDPQNTRLSVFDSSGAYLRGLRVAGGFVIMPWQGGFDDAGDYYAPTAEFEPEFRIALGRFDREYNLRQTIPLPSDPVERADFRIESGPGRVIASVPFQGRMMWRLSAEGTLWALITDQYRLLELTASGDTLRSITKSDDPIPVTDAERQEALDGLDWFTDQGGKIDASKIPHQKPPVDWFFLDDEGEVWVARATTRDQTDQPFDVFNPMGQLLGTVTVPFRLQMSPSPIVREGALYGVVRGELDVPYVVRATIRKH